MTIRPDARAAILAELLSLVPAVYRREDARSDGEPGLLESVLTVIADQFAIVDDDLDRLYDDLFIETCAPELVPYIGDLVAVYPGAETGGGTHSTRQAVAEAVALRRRKGTLAALEQLAASITEWPSVATETYRTLAVTPHLQSGPARPATVSLRSPLALERAGGPFGLLPRRPEMRRIGSGRGRNNVGNIAITLWRGASLRHRLVDPAPVDARRYRFDPLGLDRQLIRASVPEPDRDHLAGPSNVPGRLTRRDLADGWSDADTQAPSIRIRISGQVVPQSDLVACDLSDTASGWSNVARLAPSQVAVDPQLGRLAFGSQPAEPPLVSFDIAASSRLGGWAEREPFAATVSVAHGVQGLAAGIAALGPDGVLAIDDSRSYAEDPSVAISGQRVRIAGAAGELPRLMLSVPWRIAVPEGCSLELAGLVITGAPVIVTGRPRSISVSDCTLVPGGVSFVLAIDSDHQTEVAFERCITGTLHVPADGTQLGLIDCIVDAGGGVAIAADATGTPGATLSLARSTVLGSASVVSVGLVEDSILAGPLVSTRAQTGCVQFSWLAAGSVTPRRHRCTLAASGTTPPFLSTRYGSPDYVRLRRRADSVALIRGAGDGFELGALAHRRTTQRDDNLRRGLVEFLRWGLEAGTFDGD